MKQIITIAVLGIAVVCSQVSETRAQAKKDITAKWVPVKSDDGRFEVKLPGKAKVQDQTIPTAVGPVKMRMWIYEKSDAENEQAIIVSYNDYPAAQIALANPKDVLKGAQQGALGSLQNSKITTEKEIDFQGRPGREFRFEGTQGDVQGYAAWTVVMDGGRLYQVGMIDMKRKIDEKTIKAVMKSFKLNKKSE